MRFYSAGVYQSPYARARDVASLLTDIGSKGTDLASIQVMNGNTEVIGIVGNRNVFRVFEDDVIYNNTTAEGLANDWINNIKSAVNLAKLDNPPTGQTPQTGQQLASPTEASTRVPERASLPVSVKKVTPQPAVARRIPWNLIVGVILIVAITGIAWIVGRAWRKRRTISAEDNVIQHKTSTDELENTVSHLIAELEEKSTRITSDFQEKIEYLESLMMSVDKKIELLENYRDQAPAPKSPQSVVPDESDDHTTAQSQLPEREAEEDLPPPVKVARKPSEPKVKEKAPSVTMEKQHRTKQEIIYELSDQGKSMTDIAKKLGIGVGEVKLILDLKQ